MGVSPGNHKYQVWQPLLLALCAVIGLIAGGHLNQHRDNDTRVQNVKPDDGRELNEIVRFIEEKYVDDVNSDALISSAISALLKDLDPHSGYLSPEEVRELNEKMEGHFEGIGIEFQRLRDTAVILYVTPDGPADKAGLKVYDRIVKVNDSLMTSPNLSEMDMVEFMRGAKESSISLQIARHGVDSLIGFSLVRDLIPLKSVPSAYMIEKNVGYIRVDNFSAQTYREFMEHLDGMTQQDSMQDLIIDLRHNPGGYLKEAVNILSQLFEEKGLLLVYTEGKHAPKTEYRTTGKPFYHVGNIAVLVDGGSASASEIVAGALQDQDRAIIIGTPTYGKGLVQEQYALSNGGALRLTIARYYTPSGRLIQKPYHNGDAVDENGQEIRDTTVYHTAAGRKVRGSGGITPDIMVDWDMDWEDARISQLYNDVLQYAFYGYQDTTHYTSVADLVARFPSGEEIVNGMNGYFSSTSSDSTTTGPINFAGFETYSRLLLMAMIGTDRFGHDAWYEVMNTGDPVVQKALEVIKDDRRITLKYD